jgi:iturin family lipopeptide synthetase C
MIIAMLRVLKAGGAYVLIDPNYPDERIGYILDDTKTKVLIINGSYRNR